LVGTPIPSNANPITRIAGATIVLSTENEWYKAAYYNPATHSCFLYPTSSNTIPTASAPTEAINSVNFFPGGPGNLTDVGAYSGTTSPYGAFDMGGNVGQWNENLNARGGSFPVPFGFMKSSVPGDANSDIHLWTTR
jgi:formylglycine-generating enzyme required for sulfatase activity